MRTHATTVVAWVLWLTITAPTAARLVVAGIIAGHRLARSRLARRLRTAARYVGRAGLWLSGWSGRLVAAAVRGCWHLARAAWRLVEPWARDAAGWLVHTAPRLVPRLAWRGLRTGFRWSWRTLRFAFVGLCWVLARLAPYLVGYLDYAAVLRQALDEGNAKRAKRLREQWRRTARRRLSTAAALLLGSLGAVLVAAARVGGWVTYATAALGVLVLAAVGRKVSDADDRTPAEQERAEGQPYPIADAHTRAEAAECVARAIKEAGIDLRGTEEARRERWGWTVPVVLRRGAPADLIEQADALETTLDLPAGGLMPATDIHRRARVVLRLAERDPFADIPTPPHHAPGSLSIVDPHVIGQRIDGAPLALGLLRVHVVIIGVTGSGKTLALRALADIVTACRDAIVWDIDPTGDGLDAFGQAISRRARTPDEIEQALTDAVHYAHARAHLLTTLDMGDSWQPSHTHPSIVVFADEYTHLTDRAKTLAVQLLRTGRKAAITLILAANESKADALGRAIADSVACKIMLPSRHADIRLTLGVQRVAEGWRPDRLHPAAGDDPQDAGRCYVDAAGHRDPLVSALHHYSRTHAATHGRERATAGLSTIDKATLDAARTNPANTTSAEHETVDTQAIIDLIDACGEHAKLWTVDILTRLSTVDERYAEWDAETLAACLRPLGIAPTQVKINGRNRNGYHLPAIVEAWNTRQAGGGVA